MIAHVHKTTGRVTLQNMIHRDGKYCERCRFVIVITKPVKLSNFTLRNTTYDVSTQHTDSFR